jgi:hypothetical protein
MLGILMRMPHHDRKLGFRDVGLIRQMEPLLQALMLHPLPGGRHVEPRTRARGKTRRIETGANLTEIRRLARCVSDLPGAHGLQRRQIL